MSGLSLPGRGVPVVHRVRHHRTSERRSGGVALLNRSRVETVLGGFPRKTILVLGDVMLDEFIWGKVRRISPEAPVPVVEVTSESYLLGGSGNVAANIRALDGMPIAVGIIGRDLAAERILRLMSDLGIDITGLIRDDRPTTL